MISKYDVEFINPKGRLGILYAIEASSPEEAEKKAPEALSVASQWRPDQFRVISVKTSIYAVESEEQS